MIIAPRCGFVLLSLPKVASTSLETALAGVHEALPGRAPDKHQGLVKFHERTVPRIAALGHDRDAYDVVCLFRDPVDWLESWWRYRRRPDVRLRRPDRWTGDTAFDDFVRLFLDDKAGTGIRGRPARFVAGDADRGIRIDRVFAVERPDTWTAWFSGRTGEPLEVPHRNTAVADRPPALSGRLRTQLEAFFAPEYDVVAHLRAGGGTWAPPPGYRPPGLDVDA